MREKALTQRVIDCFYAVYNELGSGLPEVLYAGALEILFREATIPAMREHPVEMRFHGYPIGTYRLDFLVQDTVVLELRAGPVMPPGSRAQLLTYLRASNKSLGLVLYFGPTPDVKRVVL